MSLLKEITPENASGKLAKIYQEVEKLAGTVPNGIKFYSENPDLLEKRFDTINYYMQHKTLNHKLMAFVRLLISVRDKNEYCIDKNQNILLKFGISAEEIDATKNEPSKAPLSEKDVAMLLFVLKFVNDTANIDTNDIEKLRNIGWNDSEILAAANHGTTQVSTNTLLNGFKVKVD